MWGLPCRCGPDNRQHGSLRVVDEHSVLLHLNTGGCDQQCVSGGYGFWSSQCGSLLLKSMKVRGSLGVLFADVHSVMWQLMSGSFFEKHSCRVDPLFIELFLFVVWSLDAFVANCHPAWQVFCKSLAFAFLEVAEDAQLSCCCRSMNSGYAM